MAEPSRMSTDWAKDTEVELRPVTPITRLSPHLYANAIIQHSSQGTHQSLYPGQNYDHLVKNFQQSLRQYRYLPTGLSLAALYKLKPPVKTVTQLRAPEDFLKILDSEDDEKTSYLLFLKGNPSSEWMKVVGSSCSVDPEFFQRWQRPLNVHAEKNYFSFPSLPSTSENIITLPLVTIGVRENKTGAADQKALNLLREDAAKRMKVYTDLFKSEADIGDSIVRRYNVHDEKYFSLEQEMSITVSQVRNKWLALVSLDVGRDLRHGQEVPWLKSDKPASSWKTRLYPTIQHQPGIALRSPKLSASSRQNTGGVLSQSASLLHEGYGEFLDTSIMHYDPFYAMHELFAFVAFQEVQYLNMIDDILNTETEHTMLEREPTLLNLCFNQGILERHKTKFEELVEVVRRRGSPDWPKVTDMAKQVKAELAAKKLERDYEYLLNHICCLLGRCEKGIQVTMNSATIAQLKLSHTQGDQVAKLTMLAFFYIPFNFVASFFGMNVVEFDTGGKLEIWLWFALSGPVFVLSLLFLVYDVPAFFRRVFSRGKTKR